MGDPAVECPMRLSGWWSSQWNDPRVECSMGDPRVEYYPSGRCSMGDHLGRWSEGGDPIRWSDIHHPGGRFGEGIAEGVDPRKQYHDHPPIVDVRSYHNDHSRETGEYFNRKIISRKWPEVKGQGWDPTYDSLSYDDLGRRGLPVAVFQKDSFRGR